MSETPPTRSFPFDALPLGEARLQRPSSIRPLTFDMLLHRQLNTRVPLDIVPIESVQAGDTQVFAAREDRKPNSPTISLDALAGYPRVRSVVASTSLQLGCLLPNLAELLFITAQLMPGSLAMDNLTGLESLYAPRAFSNVRIALERLPIDTMRQLSIPRWAVRDVTAVRKLTRLRQLTMELYPADTIEPISELQELNYLRVSSGKGWASLRACINLEEAHLIQARVANLRRFGSWNKLRHLVLTGAGVKSLDGMEQFENLETLTLIMVNCKELAPLSGLSRLTDLTLRYVPASKSLEALSRLTSLSHLRIDQSVGSNRDILRVETLRPLSGLENLQEVTLLGTAIADGDLSPLVGLPKLRRVVLGRHIAADVDKLKNARPDLEIHHHTPEPKPAGIVELVGEITIHSPSGELKQWFIQEDLTTPLDVGTNHAAEQLLKRTLKKIAPDLLRRIDFDTEGDAVSIFADAESDIRAVAKVLNDMLKPQSAIP